MWAFDQPCLLICLLKCLIYFCTPRFLWLSSVLHFSPPDSETISSFVVSPIPSRLHATVYLSFSLRPTTWVIESFWLPGTMQRTEISLWGNLSLDHFSWGCATSWILRSLQWSSSKTRYCLLIAFPANVISLCFGSGIFNDIRKALPYTHYY